jgi:lipopolysaccharide export system protein LptC
MLNPRFTGLDRRQRPFTVTADSARQSDASSSADEPVALDKPKGNVETHEGAWIVTTGDTGIYQPQAHLLDLFGNVTLFHDRGYTFATHSARMDLQTGDAEGHEPVAGQGPAGTIDGEGFKVVENGDTVIFTGKAKALLQAAHHDEKVP